MKPKTKFESLNVDTKTHSGEAISQMIFIYVPMFNTGLPKSLLRFLNLLQKNIKVQSMKNGPQMYALTDTSRTEKHLAPLSINPNQTEMIPMKIIRQSWRVWQPTSYPPRISSVIRGTSSGSCLSLGVKIRAILSALRRKWYTTLNTPPPPFEANHGLHDHDPTKLMEIALQRK